MQFPNYIKSRLLRLPLLIDDFLISSMSMVTKKILRQIASERLRSISMFSFPALLLRRDTSFKADCHGVSLFGTLLSQATHRH